MKRFLPLLLCLPGIAGAITPQEIKQQFESKPEMSGGVYYAYPFATDSVPEFPAGYSPVYISHYGRHGSRWAIHESPYTNVLKIFNTQKEQGNLTPLGEQAMAQVQAIADHAQGHAGELSPLGQRQHKGIAERMMRRTPTLFADSAQISALSSIVPRCIISMSAFTERLKEMNPELQISRASSPGDMDFIAYSSEEYRKVTDDSLGWKRNHKVFRDSVIPTERVISLLFKKNPELKSPVSFVKALHDIAITTQNTDLDVNMYPIFTTDELYGLWQSRNYDMYVRHANSPEGQRAGMNSARSLLDDIIWRADSALSGAGPNVQLRFGHDTILVRLLALMQLDGFSNSETNPNQYYAAWQDFKVTPMGANLQLIFLQPNAYNGFISDRLPGVNPSATDDETLVLILHNERPVTLPISTATGSSTQPFYRWSDLKSLWTK